MDVVRRYVAIETLKVFLATVAVTLLLMTLGGGAKEGLRKGLPPQLIVQTLPFIMPEMLRFTIPGCLLFAVCSVFGRMSASNEIVAIKSLGINPMKIVWPVLVLAYLMSIVTFCLYDVCALWSRPGLRDLVTNSIDDIAYSFLRANGSFSGQGMSIVVKGVSGNRLLQPVVTFAGRGDNPGFTLTAEEARLQVDKDYGLLRFECRNGELDVGGQGFLRFPDQFVHSIALHENDPQSEDHLSPAALASRSIPAQIIRENRLIAELRRDLAETERDAEQRRGELQRAIDDRRLRLFRLKAEVSRRLSNGFGCLCFALIGVPVAMWGRSGDTMSVFFLCFLPILVVYYPLLATGENFAREGLVPELSVWLPNLVLLGLSVLLFQRVTRH